MHAGFWRGNLKEGDRLEDTCSWKDNSKMDYETKWVVDWIHLVQGMDKWRACVDTVINFEAPQNAGFD
jgi:hypothetical protein